MSPKTLDLWRYVIQHKHELETILTSALTEGTSGIRGRVDAIGTTIRRRLSGNGALFVYREPKRTYEVGPNQLVAWVLRKAHSVAESLEAGDQSEYTTMRKDALKLTYDVLRIDAMRALCSTALLQSARPSISAVKQAAASRRPIYRKAYETYALLLAVENGEEDAINSVLRETLIAPLKTWQSFELFTALTVARAVADKTGQDMRIADLSLGSEEPIIHVGSLAILWQRQGVGYRQPTLECYEQKISSILDIYGTPYASDRPDIVIVDELQNETVSIVEAKYFEKEQAGRDAFRDAVEQVVRYARGYQPQTPLDDLLGRSLVAVMSRAELQPTAFLAAGVPSLVDFEDMAAGRFDPWLGAVLAGRSAPPSAGSSSAS
jgi:hypothetical protein